MILNDSMILIDSVWMLLFLIISVIDVNYLFRVLQPGNIVIVIYYYH